MGETVPNDDAQVDAMIALLKSYSITKVGMIYTTDAYAGTLATTFKDKWLAEGYTLSPSWDDTPSLDKGQFAQGDNALTAITTIKNLGIDRMFVVYIFPKNISTQRFMRINYFSIEPPHVCQRESE